MFAKGYFVFTSYFVFKVASPVLKQDINIPIADSIAWFWERLFYCFVKWKYIKNVFYLGLWGVFKYHGTGRFIDALCVNNYCNGLSNSSQFIYPKKLELKIEHQWTHASFKTTSLYISSVIREITFSSSELKRHIGLVTCSIFNFMVYSILNYYWYMYSSFLFDSFITNNIDLLNAIWWRCILLLLLFFELIPFFTLVVMGGGTWSFLEGTKGKHCFFGYQLMSLSHYFFHIILQEP